MLELKCRVHKMFNDLEMKLPVMGSVGEKHHHIASRSNIHHSTKGLVQSWDLIGE